MLTQLKITSAKPKASPYNLSDGQGLALVIQPTGSKLWSFRYRFAGKAKTLHLGPWPGTSLADAREKCREARKSIDTGLNPVLEKKRAKVTARYPLALAPLRVRRPETTSLTGQGVKNDFMHLFLPDLTSLQNFARDLSPDVFFKMLESTLLSEIIFEVRVTVSAESSDKHAKASQSIALYSITIRNS